MVRALWLAAVVSGVWAKVWEDRLKRRDQHREDADRTLRHGAVGGGRLSVRDITDPVVVGARRTRDHDGDPLPYVRREVHPDVVRLCVPGNFVLVVGDPLSSKTRLAYEALREALPGARFVAPENREVLDAAVNTAAACRGVLWLDDLDRFLGQGGLTVAAIVRMAPGVVVATIRRDRLAVLLAGESRRVLDLARQVSVEALVSEIHGFFLAERDGDLLRPESLEEAWRWLTEPRGATVAFLRAIDDDQVQPFAPPSPGPTSRRSSGRNARAASGAWATPTRKRWRSGMCCAGPAGLRASWS